MVSSRLKQQKTWVESALPCLYPRQKGVRLILLEAHVQTPFAICCRQAVLTIMKRSTHLDGHGRSTQGDVGGSLRSVAKSNKRFSEGGSTPRRSSSPQMGTKLDTVPRITSTTSNKVIPKESRSLRHLLEPHAS